MSDEGGMDFGEDAGKHFQDDTISVSVMRERAFLLFLLYQVMRLPTQQTYHPRSTFGFPLITWKAAAHAWQFGKAMDGHGDGEESQEGCASDNFYASLWLDPLRKGYFHSPPPQLIESLVMVCAKSGAQPSCMLGTSH